VFILKKSQFQSNLEQIILDEENKDSLNEEPGSRPRGDHHKHAK
jgi:hypothetical protein